MAKRKKHRTRAPHHISLFKAITWRMIATTTTAVIVFVLTGSWELGLGAGLADVLIKIGLYYGHERAWEEVIHKLHWER